MSDKVFCGIEGGASCAKVVLINGNGKILCTTEGPSCNYLLLGIEECQMRLVDMVEKAKKEAGIDTNIILDGLGLCMSGCEEEEANKELEKNFTRKHPSLMKNCLVASDVLAPIYVASPNGGLVLIAGTGSNSLLVNPDGSTARCGGWGHLLGDEASAMWISLKAIKTFFDDEDNLVKCPYDTSKVKELMLKHFKVKDKFGILEHCYTNFNKTFFAGLCVKLAEAAVTEKDPLCCSLFYEAGKVLGAMVVAFRPKVHQSLLDLPGGLPIVCVGSVFKSWPLLEKGFFEGLAGYDKCTLMTLNCSAAIGAAYLVAKSAGHELHLDCDNYVSVLCTYDAASNLSSDSTKK